MQRQLIPFGPRILVRKADAPDEVGGIAIPDEAKESPSEGVILDIGEIQELRSTALPISLAVGDTVLFSRFAGTKVEINRNEFVYLLHIEEVFGRIVTPEAE